MSNRITAYFRGRVGVTEALYQNDYGIVMNFDDIDLPAHFDCYFSTPGEDEAVPAIGADNMVQIPNAILARSGRAELHIPIHSGANDSEVEYIVHFKVIGRARPVDDGTPVQMTAIEQALALLQNPIGNIEQIVNEALAFTGDTFAEMQAQLDADQAAFKTEVRGDIADVESDFDNLNAQYQTAVAALTVDSEVQNVRVGADNVTYASAGESVRTQFTNLKSDFSKVCESVTNDLIASAYRKDGYYVDQSNGAEYAHGPFCYYRTNCTDDMIGKHYMLTGTGEGAAQVVFFNSNEIGTSHYISGVNYARDFVIPQNTEVITISLDKTATIACTPYLFPISSPVVNSDVELSNNEDYKAVESYVTIDTNDLREKAIVVEGAYVNYDSGTIARNGSYRYYIIPCSSSMIGKIYNTTVGHQVTFFDSDGVYVSGVDTNHTTPLFTFTVPSNTAYIVVSSHIDADTAIIPNGEIYRFSKVLADDITVQSAGITEISTNDLRQTAEVVEGAYVNYDSGTISFNDSYKYYRIPCSQDMVGRVFNTTIGHQVAFFNANNEYLSGVDTNHTTPLFTFTVPSNTGFITVSSHVDADTPVVPNGEAYQYSKHLADDISASEYVGMKYCAIGDSITNGDLAELPSTGVRTPYHLVASNMLGLIDINKGVSGSRMAVTDEPDVPTPIVTRVLQLDGTEGYDFITVMGGTNDSLVSVPVGTINDVVQTTFAGAINVICQHLKSIYPIGRIGFITPLRYNINDSVELPYVEMMQAVCAKWGIPVYDAFHNSGISVFNISNGALVYDWQSFGYYGDELHPNWKGHEMFGRKVAEYLKTL